MSTTLRLRNLVEVNPPSPAFDSVDDDAVVTFMPLEAVWADDKCDLTRRRPKHEVGSGYVRFQEGDILSPKVTPTFQAGRSAWIGYLPTRAGAASTEVHVVRAIRGRSDPRFIRYVLLSKPFLDEGVSQFQGVAGLQRVPAEFLRDFPVTNLTIEQQRRIANFLVDQVSRIDNIIAAREQQRSLVSDHFRSQISSEITSGGTRCARLGYFASVQSGVTVDGGRNVGGAQEVSYLRVANVQAGSLSLDEIKTIQLDDAQIARSTLQDGDVLMTEGGDIDKLGRGTVWRCQLPGTVVHQNHVFAVRMLDDKLSPDYLAFVTLSFNARSYFELTASKTTNLASTSAAKVLALPIPVRSRHEQDQIVRHLDAQSAASTRAESMFASSVTLMNELKRSLITAAVSGEFDVSSADGSQVPVGTTADVPAGTPAPQSEVSV